MTFIQKIAESAKQFGSRARDFSGKAGEKARDLTKKSSELIEVTRMKHEMKKMEKEMENNLAGIGALYYQQQIGRETAEEELQRLIESTKELETEMKDLEEQINSMQPLANGCTECGKELPEGGKYCCYCGKKIIE